MPKPIEFPEQNFVYGVPKGSEHLMIPLPCWRDKQITLSLWELTDEEVEFIVKERKVWLKQLNWGQPLQAQLIVAGPVEFPKKFAWCSVYYRATTSLKMLDVYNGYNQEIPDLIELEGQIYKFDEKYQPRYHPNRELDIDDFFFRPVTGPEEAAERIAVSFDAYLDSMKLEKGLPLVQYPMEVQEMAFKIEANAFSLPVLCRKLQGGKEEIIC